MKPGYLYVLALALFLLVFSAGYVAQSMAEEIDVAEAARIVKKNPKNLVILDVRTPSEFKEGHIPNARNMDFFGGGFERQIKSLPKDAQILLYCRSGKRSAGAAEMLSEEGYKNILHMHDGLEVWRKAGFPVEKEKGAE